MNANQVLLKILLGVCLIGRTGTLPAQSTFYTIKGKVTDEATRAPIPYAAIHLKNTAIGTASNGEGDFVFHVPARHRADTLLVSMMGYQNYRTPVSSLPDTFLRVSLHPVATQLLAVTVTASRKKALSAKQIVKKAVDAIGDNYPVQPFRLEGFFRDLQVENGKPVELLEAAVSFSYPDYNPGYEGVHIREVRRSFNQRDPINGTYDRQNSVVDLMEDNYVKGRFGPLETKRYAYRLDSTLACNGKRVYAISATNGPATRARLYIDTDTYAIVKIELTRNMVDGEYYKRARNINDQLGAQETAYRIVLEFREYRGKMYLHYQREEDEDLLFDQPTGKVRLKQSFMKELFINAVIVENAGEPDPARNMNINRSTESQAGPYNAAFWQYYNVPAQTAHESKIIAELENR